MLLALLLLAQTTGPRPTPTSTPAATPTTVSASAPAATSPTPTPVVTDPLVPKTLADLARERKGKRKPAGSLTTYQGTPAGDPGAALDAAGGRPSLRVVEVVSSGQKSAGSFVGTLRNVGSVDACEIRIVVEAVDTKGKGLGNLEVAPGVTTLKPGESATFEGTINVGASVSKEEAELGGGALEHEVRARGGGVVGSFRGVVKSASGACAK